MRPASQHWLMSVGRSSRTHGPVSGFCTEQGIWASIKPLSLHLYVNPEGQLRAQGCARSSWAADGRQFAVGGPYGGIKSSLGCKFGVQATVRTGKSLTVGFRPLPDWTPLRAVLIRFH